MLTPLSRRRFSMSPDAQRQRACLSPFHAHEFSKLLPFIKSVSFPEILLDACERCETCELAPGVFLTAAGSSSRFPRVYGTVFSHSLAVRCCVAARGSVTVIEIEVLADPTDGGGGNSNSPSPQPRPQLRECETVEAARMAAQWLDDGIAAKAFETQYAARWVRVPGRRSATRDFLQLRAGMVRRAWAAVRRHRRAMSMANKLNWILRLFVTLFEEGQKSCISLLRSSGAPEMSPNSDFTKFESALVSRLAFRLEQRDGSSVLCGAGKTRLREKEYKLDSIDFISINNACHAVSVESNLSNFAQFFIPNKKNIGSAVCFNDRNGQSVIHIHIRNENTVIGNEASLLLSAAIDEFHKRQKSNVLIRCQGVIPFSERAAVDSAAAMSSWRRIFKTRKIVRAWQDRSELSEDVCEFTLNHDAQALISSYYAIAGERFKSGMDRDDAYHWPELASWIRGHCDADKVHTPELSIVIRKTGPIAARTE